MSTTTASRKLSGGLGRGSGRPLFEPEDVQRIEPRPETPEPTEIPMTAADELPPSLPQTTRASVVTAVPTRSNPVTTAVKAAIRTRTRDIGWIVGISLPILVSVLWMLGLVEFVGVMVAWSLWPFYAATVRETVSRALMAYYDIASFARIVVTVALVVSLIMSPGGSAAWFAAATILLVMVALQGVILDLQVASTKLAIITVKESDEHEH
jgi:hypothetical protein